MELLPYSHLVFLVCQNRYTYLHRGTKTSPLRYPNCLTGIAIMLRVS